LNVENALRRVQAPGHGEQPVVPFGLSFALPLDLKNADARQVSTMPGKVVAS
jgi:hypothetical protein